jgi:zinc protease
MRGVRAALGGLLAFGLIAGGARANMAEKAHRSRSAGIDVVTYRTNVRDVVVLLGALPAGDAMAGSGNIAVPTLSGLMLDRGTKKLDKFEIAARLEDVGAQLSFEVGAQSLEIRAKCLKKDLPLLLSLLSEELRTPAFSAAEFARAKQQFIGSLRESLQNSTTRAREAFARAVFPPGHPNRPHAVEEFLAAAESATLEDVEAFHARYVGPKHMTLILVGDVPEAEAGREIAKDFAGWRGGEDYLRPAAPAAAMEPGEIRVPLKDKPSTSVFLGQATGLRYKDPDTLALRVGTAVLGQGFTGRLGGTVRDREGLTYFINAAVTDDAIADGAFRISASFAPSLLDQGVASTRRVLEYWWQQGITDAELAARRQGLVGGYEVGLSTSAGLAGIILATLQRGYDLDWLDRYPQAVKGVTREQVNRAVRAHLDPAKMVLVEAGSVADGGTPVDGATPTGGGTTPAGSPTPR